MPNHFYSKEKTINTININHSNFDKDMYVVVVVCIVHEKLINQNQLLRHIVRILIPIYYFFAVKQ